MRIAILSRNESLYSTRRLIEACERRYVISTKVELDGQSWPIEITLTNRDNMRFRMLLGCTAMEKKVIVNPAKSYVLGKP